MKQFTIFILATLALMGCMNKEERTICDYLNSKLSSSATKAKKVEILSVDSVLSFAPLTIMYNEYLRDPADGDVAYKAAVYLYHAQLVRTINLTKQSKTKELIQEHEFDWRKLVKTKVTAEDGHVIDNVEIIYDNDGITPIKTGTEYDQDLEMWKIKFGNY